MSQKPVGGDLLVTVPAPTVDAFVAFVDLPGQTFQITHILGSAAFADGWGYTIQAFDGNGWLSTTLLRAEYGTSWEYTS